MNEKAIEIFVGFLFISFGFILSGIGYMVYIEQSKIVALSGIPLAVSVFVFGAFLLFKGFKDDH